jgi:F-type H+-transporting ATPase subunit b
MNPVLLAAAGAEHESPSLFAGDLGNTIWTLVIFLAVLGVLGKFAWGPILTTLQRREQFIRESLEQAKHDRDEADKRLHEYEEKLHKATQEASGILEEGRRDAEAARSRIQEQARSEADAMIERGRREIGLAKDAAVKDLYQLVANLAADVSSKLLRRSLNEDEQRRLVDQAMAEMRDKLGNGTN